jgi:hypothetical protein
MLRARLHYLQLSLFTGQRERKIERERERGREKVTE